MGEQEAQEQAGACMTHGPHGCPPDCEYSKSSGDRELVTVDDFIKEIGSFPDLLNLLNPVPLDLESQDQRDQVEIACGTLFEDARRTCAKSAEFLGDKGGREEVRHFRNDFVSYIKKSEVASTKKYGWYGREDIIRDVKDYLKWTIEWSHNSVKKS